MFLPHGGNIPVFIPIKSLEITCEKLDESTETEENFS